MAQTQPSSQAAGTSRQQASIHKLPERCHDDDGDEFVQLLKAYRCSGGLARADDLLNVFRSRGGPDLSTLARWLVERRVVGFEWQGATWLPLFQFSQAPMHPRADVAPVLAELNSVYGPWELAQWLVRPNSAVAGRTPVEALNASPASVVSAARADRLLING